MRRSLTGIGLAGSALLGLLLVSGRMAGGSADRPADPAKVLRQLGVADSIADQWVAPYIPLWALTQDAPVVGPEGSVNAFTSSVSTECPPSFELSLLTDYLVPHFDSVRGVTELYNGDFLNNRIVRFDVSADLSYTSNVLEIEYGHFWVAEDLTLDGNAELVTQFWDSLLIRSTSDGALLAGFCWPGCDVEMNPTLVNIDDDPYLEIYVTPNTSGSSRVVLIDYDTVSGAFVKLVDIAAPNRAVGQPAVGDFDEDGRMEFISGNNDTGYELYEWQAPNLVHIGMVGDTTDGNNFKAVACRPKPGGVLHALLGNSSPDVGFRYQLLEPTGDNTFQVVQVFQEYTGWHGGHGCWAVDGDCDGLDELVLDFYPLYKEWEWDNTIDQFLPGCIWDEATYGALLFWHTVDLNQDGASEFGSVSLDWVFYAFADAECVYCDSTGRCPAVEDCFCVCAADPVCDGQVNVLDVVSAVDVAFRSGSPALDPFPQCPVERTDVDCSGFTDVLDVVHLVNVAFRSGEPSVEFCQSCP